GRGSRSLRVAVGDGRAVGDLRARTGAGGDGDLVDDGDAAARRDPDPAHVDPAGAVGAAAGGGVVGCARRPADHRQVDHVGGHVVGDGDVAGRHACALDQGDRVLQHVAGIGIAAVDV